MGCVVNGPGESKAANIGISLPGTGEAPNCPVFIDGEHFTTLRGTYDELADGFRALVDNYVDPLPDTQTGRLGGLSLPPVFGHIRSTTSEHRGTRRWIAHVAGRGSAAPAIHLAEPPHSCGPVVVQSAPGFSGWMDDFAAHGARVSQRAGNRVDRPARRPWSKRSASLAASFRGSRRASTVPPRCGSPWR